MAKEESLYEAIGNSIDGVVSSQMFGKPCFKVNGKAFICFFENCLVCKLEGMGHDSAMALKGTKLFDPSGKGRAMKEWVQVPYTYKEKWKELAVAACKICEWCGKIK
jgi:hypothetical protein